MRRMSAVALLIGGSRALSTAAAASRACFWNSGT